MIGLRDINKTDPSICFIYENKSTKCPEINITFNNKICLKAIIDSGSEVNLISERAFEELTKTNSNIPILPVENVVLVTAFGKRSSKIKQQVLLEFTIEEDKFEGIFMISPQLNNELILGYQLLREYDIDINCGKDTISYFKNGIQRRILVPVQNTHETKTTTNSLETLILTNVQESESESEWDKFKLLPIMNNIEEKTLKVYSILEKYKD
jgi:RNase H-fold protein (predicted Holliday junction resolvase)